VLLHDLPASVTALRNWRVQHAPGAA
jgi:hypothetical protein